MERRYAEYRLDDLKSYLKDLKNSRDSTQKEMMRLQPLILEVQEAISEKEGGHKE